MKSIPEDCPKELIEIMEICLDQIPHNRPDFSEIVEALKTLNF